MLGYYQHVDNAPDSTLLAVYLSFWLAGAAVWVVGSLRLAEQDGLSRWRAGAGLSLLVPVVFLGARFHALLLEERTPLRELPWEHVLQCLLQPAFRLPGGLLLALLVAPLVAAGLRISFSRLADSAAPFVGVALGIGRLGCLAVGCCFGRLSELPWAISYPPGTAAYTNHAVRHLIPYEAPASLPVHPLPAYCAMAGCAVAVALFWLRPRRLYAGEVGLALVALLGSSMAALEFWREGQGTPPVPLRQAIPASVAVVAAATLVSRRFGAILHHGVSEAREESASVWADEPCREWQPSLEPSARPRGGADSGRSGLEGSVSKLA